MANEIVSRMRYGEAFWRAHHEAWCRSELNQREYCEAHGIPLKAFGNWRAKFKAEPRPLERKLLYRRGGLSHTLTSRTSLSACPTGTGSDHLDPRYLRQRPPASDSGQRLSREANREWTRCSLFDAASAGIHGRIPERCRDDLNAAIGSSVSQTTGGEEGRIVHCSVFAEVMSKFFAEQFQPARLARRRRASPALASRGTVDGLPPAKLMRLL